ncbi:MAG: ASKHA domain-containing protein [Treponema sp.]|jgi:uncharacterized 2Fe-2S/4Fe-4S cluster protein (DUF4445 family)|nr:ASKHA domain-containing protein [Treponema sp.]
MPNSFLLHIHGGKTFEIENNETVLSALLRAGIALSAPCGGKGICGKCRVKLIDGDVLIMETGEMVNSGDSFCACKGTALSDMTVQLPEETLANLFDVHTGKKIKRAGAAIDIGTTTVCAQLVDLDTGNVQETITALNAQRGYGADVMSRINAARNGKKQELYAAIHSQIENILTQFIQKRELPDIRECVISGNTAMLHLFLNVDPSAMGEVPFKPEFLEERRIKGGDISLHAKEITLLPGISAFVGADIVSGLAFLDITKTRQDCLFVDIGTNGEIALWKENEKNLYCCSTAAGPCFEGAEISCGMAALNGAINKVWIVDWDSKTPSAAPPPEMTRSFGPLKFSVIGNIEPRGICGTGLIDTIAVMKKLAVIDETGALRDEYMRKGFPLTPQITVTQRDIRQFQLAKSAIFSGINVICKKAGLREPGELQAVYIAGALGFFINLKNAANAGLLPQEFTETEKLNDGLSNKKIYNPVTTICGNTSLQGAVKCLIDPSFLPRCREITVCSKIVDLASDSGFADAFADNMFF